MMLFVIPLLLYILLEIFQRRRRCGHHHVNEVKELQSTFPFPPKIKQMDNAFQMIEKQTFMDKKKVILPDLSDSDEPIDEIDVVIRKRLRGSTTSGIAVVTKSLVTIMDFDKPSCAQPAEVIREVFFVFCGIPAMTVCITRNTKDINSVIISEIKEYALQLTRKLTLRLRLFTDEHISVLDGVMDVTRLEDDEIFKEGLDEILREGSKFCSPHSLLMGEKKLLNVQRATLATLATTVLDLSEMFDLEKLAEENRNQEVLWILPQAVLQEESHLLEKSGLVATTLKDENFTLLVLDIARRWEKIQPTILCTKEQLKPKIRENGIISQVICRDDIPQVRMQDNITQLVAETITQFEVKLLQEKMQKPGKYLLVNPMEGFQSNVSVRSVNENWTPDLLDRFSSRFKELKTFFENEIKRVYSCSFLGTRYTGCQVKYFSKGSVRAHVKLYFSERNDENKSEHMTPIPLKYVGEAFKEGEIKRQRTTDCTENSLQLQVVSEDHPKDQTDTGIFKATPCGRRTTDDAFDDIRNHHYKKGVFKLKGASSDEVKDIFSKFSSLEGALDAHDRDYGGNILYWSAESENRHLSKEVIHYLPMTSEILYECLAFCILQNNSAAARLIISLYTEMEQQGTEIDLNFLTENKRTVLTQAVDSKLYDVVNALLSAGADPQYALHQVCTNGDEKGLKLLLNSSHQLDINNTDSFGWTPLMITAYQSHERQFEVLLEHKPDLRVLDKLKRNVLHQACRGGNRMIILSVLNAGLVDINAKDEKGSTALMHVIKHNNNDLFQLLVDENADVKTKDNDQNSILYVAARDGSHHIVEKLLQQGPTGIDEKGQHGWTPLMVAAAYGRYEVFALLQKHEAKIKGQFDDCKNSLLHLACQGGNVDIVKKLLPLYGTKVPGENGKTPVEIAEDNVKPEVAEYIREWEKTEFTMNRLNNTTY